MNINQMMRSFLGEPSSGDARAMELRPGQIVRGVILQVMENNEALVQINGVQVRAKLELPLQAGQTAMLQVQPQSSGALIMLKQVDPGAVGLPEDTFKEWAKQLGLPEQKWAVEIVKDLRREGVILSREVAQAFQQAASAMPVSGNNEEWIRASAAAYKRGLPMTENVVGALRQVMFGRSTDELLDALKQQLMDNRGNPVSEAGQNTQSKAASRILALLAGGETLLRAAAAGSEAPVGNAGNGKHAGAAEPNRMNASQSDRPNAAAAPLSNAGDGSTEPAITSVSARSAAAGSTHWLGQMMKWLGVDHELRLTKALAAEETQPISLSSAQSAAQAEAGTEAGGSADRSRAAFPLQAVTAHAADSKAGQTSFVQGKAEGQEEQHVRLLEVRHHIDRTATLTGTQPIGADGSLSADPLQPAQQTESLKSALLSLIAADNAPAAVKETAQQLVQQITGQQLLLTPERNSSLLTHVTMFIPIHGQEGNQTASVHIQTRRGHKGELDASNCRLLFNLSMHTLGNTMVDVNVTDKIVSLNLWNDHPAIAALTESSKGEIARSLQQAGYQLLSLRTTPLPKASNQSAVLENVFAATSKAPQPPDLSQFESTRYKGVDYRV
ncbi:hypothetical protein [Paenibacillus harenae]|uniref:hypothetical protein n=1 Tax=Paenibacillus harenae TaxID=306543 RepID=UPI0003F7B240|nr:hypothetical protein [Paenibacillus harenae]